MLLVAIQKYKNLCHQRYFLHRHDLIYTNKLVRGGSVSGAANTNRH